MIQQSIKNPYGFIYITTNMISGKRYIGQKSFDCRWKKYLGSGHLLKKAIKKYGGDNFARDIVCIAYSKENLDILEKEFINNYNAVNDDNYYNIANGGTGGDSKDNKEKIKQTLISNNHTRKIYKLNKDTYEIIERYESIYSATDELNLSRSSIKNVLNPNSHSKTAGGFAWKYIDEENIKYNKEFLENKKNSKLSKQQKEIIALFNDGIKMTNIIKLGYPHSNVHATVSRYCDYNKKEPISIEKLETQRKSIINLHLSGYRNCDIQKELNLGESKVGKIVLGFCRKVYDLNGKLIKKERE